MLEAGPRDKDKFIHIPAGFAKLFRSEMDWDYLTEPQKELDGREIYWPRGKMLGGSSSMNAMMWVRGFAADYDEWAELAGEQWSYANVEKYFERIESGPLVISPQRSPRSSTAAWLNAVGMRLRVRAQSSAGRLLRNPCHAAQGSAVEHRRRVSETGAAAEEPDPAHRGHRHASAVRRHARRRGRIRAAWPATGGAGAARGGVVRRRDQQPAAADAVGHR